MIHIYEGAERPGNHALFDAMYRDRKRIFVDLRKWCVPVIDDEFEVDQFDDLHAVYCIATDDKGRHLGSIRLLPSDRPHILGDLFPDLCDRAVPTDRDIWELTRGCVSPALPATERRQVRNKLTSAVVDYALHRGITAYTCIADSSWLHEIPRLGWACRPLGAPRRIDRSITGALQVDITPRTPDLLREAGSWVPPRLYFPALAHD